MVFLCCYQDVQITKPIEKGTKKITTPLRDIGKLVSKMKNAATARTVACVPKESIVDIDAEDVNNPLAVVEYVNDIYKFYKLTERPSQVCGHIDESMRMMLVDWLVDVHIRFRLTPEILYRTVNVLDRYLSMDLVVKEEEQWQLVGITAMLLASKYEEDKPPAVDDFVDISDETFDTKQILDMERSILRKLGWNLTEPTPYHFLVRFIKAAAADKVMENLVFFFAELGLMQYAMSKYCPSLLAASAVYAAKCTLNKTPYWNETLKHYAGYSECQLMECAKQFVTFHSDAAENEYRAVYDKYSTCAHNVVALLPPCTRLLIESRERQPCLESVCMSCLP